MCVDCIFLSHFVMLWPDTRIKIILFLVLVHLTPEWLKKILTISIFFMPVSKQDYMGQNNRSNLSLFGCGVTEHVAAQRQ